jgi:hypothetical protein
MRRWQALGLWLCIVSLHVLIEMAPQHALKPDQSDQMVLFVSLLLLVAGGVSIVMGGKP